MSIGFGLLSAQIRPGDPPDWEAAYAEVLALTEHAEGLGMSSVWTTEHHFVDDGYMPSLLVTSAAMAARTRTIEIGTGVVLAPLHHPLRLAEDAATVQLLSGGRLTLGLGLGWSEPEYAALGIPMNLRGRAMDEILEILARSWSGEPFRHDGRVYSYPELAVRPTPHVPIPVLIGGGAEPAIRRAARLADGLFSNAPVARFLEQVAWVEDELEKAGRDPATFRFVHYSIIVPADQWDDLQHHVWAMSWKYSDMADSADRAGPPPTPPPLTPEVETKLRERSVIAGSAEEVVAKLTDIRRRAGVPVDFVARSYFSTLAPDRQRELMEWLAKDIGPHL
jgi:probable F420-dependent oxidoreductase